MPGLTQRLFPGLFPRTAGAAAAGGPPPLETPHLILRPFARADLPALERLYADPEATRFLQHGPYRPAKARKVARRTLDAALDEQAVFGHGLFAMVERGAAEPIGCCGVSALPAIGPERLELSYMLARARWGRGLMEEAARAVIADAFGRLGVDRLVAVSHPDNRASIRLLERLGFRYAEDVYCYGSILPCYALDRPATASAGQ